MSKILGLICVIGLIFCLEKGLEMKKIILGVIGLMVCICCFLGVVISGGFAEVHKKDIEKIYRDYWNYSLGDYQFSREVISDADQTGTGYANFKWYDYTFTFRDINNNLRNITFSNHDDDFNDEFYWVISSFLKEDIEKLFKSQNLLEIDGIKEWNVSCSVDRIDESIDFYDSEKGVKFNELNLSSANKNNISIKITIKIYVDINYYPDLKQKLLDDFKFILENYEYPNVEFKFDVNSFDD